MKPYNDQGYPTDAEFAYLRRSLRQRRRPIFDRMDWWTIGLVVFALLASLGLGYLIGGW